MVLERANIVKIRVKSGHKISLIKAITLLKNMAYTLGMITKEVTWLDSHVRKLSLNINQQIGEVTWEVQWKEKWIIWKARSY